jgi:hypothetical protein
MRRETPAGGPVWDSEVFWRLVKDARRWVFVFLLAELCHLPPVVVQQLYLKLLSRMYCSGWGPDFNNKPLCSKTNMMWVAACGFAPAFVTCDVSALFAYDNGLTSVRAGPTPLGCAVRLN